MTFVSSLRCALIVAATCIFASGCSRSPQAKNAAAVSPQARQVQKRLESLAAKLTRPGLYYDDDVRASIDAMPREVVEAIIPPGGYSDEDASRLSPLRCYVEDLYGKVSACARSFVNFLRAYSAAAAAKKSEFFRPPEWSQAGDTISLVFDSGFYRLDFDSRDLELQRVRYGRVQE